MANPTPIDAAEVARLAALQTTIEAARIAQIAAGAAADKSAELLKNAETAVATAKAEARKAPSPEATQRVTSAEDLAKLAKIKANEDKSAKTDAFARHTNARLEADVSAGDWDEIVKQVERGCVKGVIVNGVVRSCERVKKLNCAGPKPDEKARIDQATQDAMNADQGTNIDFNQLGEWEGGQAVEAYVPWWPKDIVVNDGLITANTTKLKGTSVVAGASGSGVTIGSGVDLGQQEATAYIDRLRMSGLTEELIDKLTPYMGLKRSEACRYLRAHPLEVTKEEADQIDEEMKSYHAKEAKEQYNDVALTIPGSPTFDQLSSAEQTVLMSRKYQDGVLTNRWGSQDLMEAMANRNNAGATDALSTTKYRHPSHPERILKEKKYLKGSYPAIPPLHENSPLIWQPTTSPPLTFETPLPNLLAPPLGTFTIPPRI